MLMPIFSPRATVFAPIIQQVGYVQTIDTKKPGFTVVCVYPPSLFGFLQTSWHVTPPSALWRLTIPPNSVYDNIIIGALAPVGSGLAAYDFDPAVPTAEFIDLRGVGSSSLSSKTSNPIQYNHPAGRALVMALNIPAGNTNETHIAYTGVGNGAVQATSYAKNALDDAANPAKTTYVGPTKAVTYGCLTLETGV